MKFILFALFFVFIYSISFNDAIDNLRLEEYIKKYRISHSNYTFTHLMSCYLRKKIYNRKLFLFWDIIGGDIPNVDSYILSCDLTYGTHAREGKNYLDVDLPNNETIYLFHFF